MRPGQRARGCLFVASELTPAVDRRPQALAIAAEKIEKALFATGEPRAGTTLLHALLSVDRRAVRFGSGR